MGNSRLWIIFAGSVGLCLLILWSGGFLGGPGVAPGTDPEPTRSAPDDAVVGRARLERVVDMFEAVGTIRPRTETRVEAQVQARVLEAPVREGQLVKKGDLLLRLDARELQARVDQAGQGLQSALVAREQASKAIDAAKAGFDEADSQHRRMKTLLEQKAVTSREAEQTAARFLQAEAALAQARQGVDGANAAVEKASKAMEEATIALGYADIRALEDGVVLERHIEPGDLAFPNKPLLTLQAGSTQRLEALVPESLVDRTRPGTELVVRIPALGRTVGAVVEEVAPMADPRTRTFEVKAALPDEPGLRSGMFGRLLVPIDTRQTLVVDQRAVRRVGQLETVDVVENGALRRVFVRTGPGHGADVEILSGLSANETVMLVTAPAPVAGEQGGAKNE